MKRILAVILCSMLLGALLMAASLLHSPGTFMLLIIPWYFACIRCEAIAFWVCSQSVNPTQ